ncbi:hypothetical protein D3C73_1372200 [compost metagenome]
MRQQPFRSELQLVIDNLPFLQIIRAVLSHFEIMHGYHPMLPVYDHIALGLLINPGYFQI